MVGDDLTIHKDDTAMCPVKNDQYDQYVFKDHIATGYLTQVYEACDLMDEDKKFAIKVFKNSELSFKVGTKEIKILQILGENNKNSDIVKMIDFFIFKGHLCIAYEKLEISLLELFERTNYAGLSFPEISQITKQLIEALMFAKERNIIHTDIRPEKILFVKLNCMQVKLIGWGMAKDSNESLKNCQQSLFYQSPELIFEKTQYLPQGLDIWSLGCIIGELYLGLPLFPGNSNYDLVFKITLLLGFPFLFT